MKKRLLFFFILFSNILLAQVPSKPYPVKFVNDFANILERDDVAKLEKKIKDLNKLNPQLFQLTVVTVPNMVGMDIKSFSLKLAQSLGIGKAGIDNGLLITVAKQERKVRIEVGYGLEAVITDLIASRIVDYTLTPNFKKSKFYEGLDQAIDEIVIHSGAIVPEMQSISTQDSLKILSSRAAQEIPDKPEKIKWVNDYSTLLYSSFDLYNDKLAESDRINSQRCPFIVICVNQIGGRDMALFSELLLEKWEIRNDQFKNGFVLILSKLNRNAYLSIGSQQKKYFEKSFVDSLLQYQLLPALKNDRISDSLELFIDNILLKTGAQTVNGYEFQVEKEKIEREQILAARNFEQNIIFGSISFFFLLIVFLFVFYRKKLFTKDAFTITHSGKSSRYTSSSSNYNDYSYSDYSDRSSYSDYSDRSSYSDSYSDSSFGGGSFGGGGADGSW